MSDDPRSGPYLAAVALGTVVWLVAVAALIWGLFAVGLEAWADHHSNHGLRQAELGAESARTGIWLAGVGVAGPVLIAGVALRGRLVVTGVVYLGIALLLACPAGALVVDGYRTLRPEPRPEPERTYQCMEHSGGDSTCPGG